MAYFPFGVLIEASFMRRYHAKETQMLNALGEEYLKLNTFYGAASFDINDANRELLDYLKAHRHYVSDYKEKDNQFRVSFLCK